jgi:lipid-A-disaccharide synthase
MLIAGEASGDLLAAELVRALKSSPQIRALPFAPRFFGAGGPRMAAEGVELDIDLTRHSVVGVSDVLKKLLEFKRLLDHLVDLAIRLQPEVIVCVDFSGFNRRFARALRRKTGNGTFRNWRPRIVQYVSPQVWASRPGRARKMIREIDLLLSIFPFEKEWYARRAPGMRVEFVGHPIVNRYGSHRSPSKRASGDDKGFRQEVLLLPGSRVAELNRHLPSMLKAAWLIRQNSPTTTFRLVLPNEQLARQVRAQLKLANLPEPRLVGPDHTTAVSTCLSEADIQVDGLGEALSTADLAIASTGTVTMECAFFGVPTIAIYKTSLINYLLARMLITVRHVAMPNVLANEEVFPEFMQHAASPHNIASAALELLSDSSKRGAMKSRLDQIVRSLGGTGASERAAAAILNLLCTERAASGRRH